MAMNRCPICGEKFNDTYKYCPFCEEDEALREGDEIRRTRKGARRPPHSRQFSLVTPVLIVLILAMSGLLVHLLYGDKIGGGQGDEQTGDPPPTEEVTPPDDTQEPDGTQEPDDGPGGVMPEDSDDPDDPGPADPDTPDTPDTPPEDPDTTDEPDTPPDEPDTLPEDANEAYEEAMALPDGLSLNKTDFSLFYVGESATLRASGGSGSYTWISQDDGVASVDENGKVVAISGGTINVVVTDGEKKGVCIVRCNFSGSAGTTPTTTPETPSTTTPSTTTPPTPSGGGSLRAGSAKVVASGNGVRVRSGPGTDYEILATVSNGADIQIIESAGDGWYKITFFDVGGVTTPGYMKGEFLAND